MRLKRKKNEFLVFIKMVFNEPTALEIIAKYNLKANTIKVWKTRGAIPDCYFKEGYKKPSPKTKQDTSKIRAFLNLDFITKTYFDKHLAYAGATVSFCDGEIELTEPQFEAVQTEINMFVSLWRQTLNTRSAKLLRAILAKRFLKPFVLLKNDMDKNNIKKLIYELNRGYNPPNLDKVWARLETEYFE